MTDRIGLRGITMQTVIPLKPGGYFHIFDRGVNRENIFLEGRNYAYFLNLYLHHISPVADTYAYCLLRNHFHLLIRIKADAIIKTTSASKAFNNFLTAYAKAINKAYGRTGALFQHHFGRISIHSDRYFNALVRYIHHNPCKHGFVEDFRDWPYSSYHNLLVDEPAQLDMEKLIDQFGGLKQFRKYHSATSQGKRISGLTGNDYD
jgi:putative transposase